MRNRLLLLVLCTVLVLAPTGALAQTSDPLTLSMNAGLDGYYRVGDWLLMHAILQNDGPGFNGRLEISVPRSSGGQIIYTYPLELPTQSRKEVVLPVMVERYATTLKTNLLDNTGRIVKTDVQPLKVVADQDRLYGVIAAQSSSFNLLSELDPDGGQAHVAILTANTLPDQVAALDMLDVLIISNVDTGAFTEGQRAALATWIASGGQLIAAGGSGWQKTSAGLQDLLPLQPNSSITLDNLGALQSFARSTTAPGTTVVAVGTLLKNAQVLLQQGTTPLIARRTLGQGSVTFLGFDPAELNEWDGLTDVYDRLLAAPREKPGWSYGIQDWSSALSAASNIPNLNLPPVSLICGFLGIYMLAIGPLNYIIVRRLKRRELAWISVPVLALGFMAIAFISGSLMRGSQPVLNRLAVVQVWPGSTQARLTGIAGLYAPQRATYQVQAEHGLLLHPASADNPYQAASDTSDWTISNDAATQRAQVDMDVSEMKALQADGAITAPLFAVDVQISIDQYGARAIGAVTNQSDVTLQDAVLLGPGQVKDLGLLQPGASVPVDLRLDRAGRSSQTPARAPYYYGSADSTLEDIAGSYNYFSNGNTEQARRTNLLRALLYDSDSSNARGRGSGLYLAGWSTQSPMTANMGDVSFGSYNTTLYIIDLSPSLDVASGTLVLPSGLFTWEPDSEEATPGDNIAPYDATLYPGTHALQFKLAQPVSYNTVKGLTLNVLTGNNGNTARYAVWNYQTRSWTALSNVKDGPNTIAQPGQHVGPGGVIRLKIDTSNNPVSIQQIDFTLTVQ